MYWDGNNVGYLWRFINDKLEMWKKNLKERLDSSLKL